YSSAWMPSGVIRGVNLGSLFVFEPWMSSTQWASMGCAGTASEFDCVSAMGQVAANAAFQGHWSSWVTRADLAQMKAYGLNTVRIPVGYWLREDIVYTDSEHFPQGGLAYFKNICEWAQDEGLYIIVDLHGAPGAQVAMNAFTGQYAPTPDFYVDYQFERALNFLEWMTELIHTNSSLQNVGMLELVNEPVQDPSKVGSMRSSYYPAAIARIRAVEDSLGISDARRIHVQMMNSLWGSGDPAEYLSDTFGITLDDHRYLKWTDTEVSREAYIATSCSDNRGGEFQTIVGEFSLSVPDSVQWTDSWEPSSNQAFYSNWFAAQLYAYEAQKGWIFWSWKTELGDYRWSYKDAVDAGVIPADLAAVDTSICGTASSGPVTSPSEVRVPTLGTSASSTENPTETFTMPIPTSVTKFATYSTDTLPSSTLPITKIAETVFVESVVTQPGADSTLLLAPQSSTFFVSESVRTLASYSSVLSATATSVSTNTLSVRQTPSTYSFAKTSNDSPLTHMQHIFAMLGIVVYLL
ncbi:hypothetical protein HDU84_006047, partial [Entophlyctis sp. JEL0112]